MHTKLVAEELRKRGHECAILKINENRSLKDPSYIDVQGPGDYVRKILRHVLHGFRVNVDVNAKSPKGYVLALAAALAARALNGRITLTFRGGIPQKYFPSAHSRLSFWPFWLLFHVVNAIACDNEEIRAAIMRYGIPGEKVTAITPFSSQYISFTEKALPDRIAAFLQSHSPVWLSYLCFREEFQLPTVRAGMALYRERYPKAGFLWVGFPSKELDQAHRYLDSWPPKDQDGVLAYGNLDHDEFLTLMARCIGYLRPPACDGVAASVLEALALNKPVVASENGSRPRGVLTYSELSAQEMCAQLTHVTENPSSMRATAVSDSADDNISRSADWITEQRRSSIASNIAHVR
jgi:glycosyltransferase involved in cell wall biosynthesis